MVRTGLIFLCVLGEKSCVHKQYASLSISLLTCKTSFGYLNIKFEFDRHLAGIFLAILGRGPRAFLIGKISDVNPEFGKFSEYSKLMIFSKLT